MKLAYCRTCKAAVAAGPIPNGTKPTHVVVTGKGDEATSVTHEAELIDVPDTEPLPGEKAGAYLKRLVKIHAGNL